MLVATLVVLLWVVSVVLVIISILRVLLSEAVLTRVKVHVAFLPVFTLFFVVHHDSSVLHLHHLVQLLKQCVVVFLKSKVKLKIFFVKLRRKRM